MKIKLISKSLILKSLPNIPSLNRTPSTILHYSILASIEIVTNYSFPSLLVVNSIASPTHPKKKVETKLTNSKFELVSLVSTFILYSFNLNTHLFFEFQMINHFDLYLQPMKRQ